MFAKNDLPKYTTDCAVPGCTQKFQSSPLSIEVIGEPNAQVVKFVLGLSDHLTKKHKELVAKISQAVQEYVGYLTVGCFRIEDPKLQAMTELVRAKLHRQTRKYFVSDAEITDRIARLGLDPEQEEGLGILLRDMRDILCEEGKYAPELPKGPRIIV